MAQPQERVMTQEEIQKVAPGYKGKAANFDPARAGKKSARPFSKGKPKSGPSSPDVPAPKLLATNSEPTPQKNESLLSEAVFGVDVKVQAIDPRQNFSANYARLPALADEVFQQYATDNNMLCRELDSREFRYYATALLWMKLLEVKAKQGRVSLTSAEKDIRKMCQDKSFNVPQPLFIYLSQIGDVTDKMGKDTELQVPALPIVTAGGFGGYPANQVSLESHALFEEVPSLGMMGDAVMAVSSADDDPNQVIRVALPAGAVATVNMLGLAQNIGPRRLEIRQRLSGQGITAHTFPESVQNTRFNLKYILQLSDVVGKQQTYRVEKVVFANLTLSGGETQIIMTKPVMEEDPNENWIRRTVQATSAACESTAQMGAACVFGFQLYKETEAEGTTIAARARNWSCITADATADQPWQMPVAWEANRNIRRNLPPGIGTERFRSLAQRQSDITFDVCRRLIKTTR